MAPNTASVVGTITLWLRPSLKMRRFGNTSKTWCWTQARAQNLTKNLSTNHRRELEQHLKPTWAEYLSSVQDESWLGMTLADLPQRSLQQSIFDTIVERLCPAHLVVAKVLLIKSLVCIPLDWCWNHPACHPHQIFPTDTGINLFLEAFSGSVFFWNQSQHSMYRTFPIHTVYGVCLLQMRAFHCNVWLPEYVMIVSYSISQSLLRFPKLKGTAAGNPMFIIFTVLAKTMVFYNFPWTNPSHPLKPPRGGSGQVWWWNRAEPCAWTKSPL